MIRKDQVERIETWQRNAGGSNIRPAGGALKTLGEVVELAIAAGATEAEIVRTMVAELAKASAKGEITGHMNLEAFCEECADVMICMTLLVKNNGVLVDRSLDHKLPVLEAREWEPDADGVLRRPGRTNT